MWNPFKKDKKQYEILPQRNLSYVVDNNGEPMLVFYRHKSRLFVNRPLKEDTVGFFLNIRRPLLIDASGLTVVDIPPIPEECDGIIIKGYGTHNSTAFVVRDIKAQSMQMPL